MKCVNIDWLEVYCIEPLDSLEQPLNDSYRLSSYGYDVAERGYGTPTYEQVLSLSTPEFNGLPMFEVRRLPRRNSEGGQFLPAGSCHIRLTNRFCYTENPVGFLLEFLFKCDYTFRSIKRIDICVDFNFFDDGERPQDVLNAYLAGKIQKKNQSKVSVYGAEMWDGVYYNSIRWGSPYSNIATRFYNKSLELKEVKRKSYIEDAWHDAGLRFDLPVWRVEFQVKAGRKGFRNVKSQDFADMKPSQFDSRSKLLFVFYILTNQYFSFSKVEFNADGSRKRKDRCTPKNLFKIALNAKTYTTSTKRYLPDLTKTDKMLLKRCKLIATYPDVDDLLKDSAEVLALYLSERLDRYGRLRYSSTEVDFPTESHQTPSV